MNKTIIAIIITILLIGGAIFLTKGNDKSSNDFSSKNSDQEIENIQNVSIVDGKQIIEIDVKGGYLPRISVAKAGIPTVVRFKTNKTFDCSSSIRIPSLNISEILPNTGTKEIDLGTPNGGTLQGSCGMGMYPFQIKFE